MERTDGQQSFGWWSRMCRALAVFFLKMIPADEGFDMVLYKAMAPFITSFVVEAAILRRREGGGFEVWLEKRHRGNGTDPEWFCPGRTLRRGETTDDVFKRIVASKNQGPVRIVHRHLLGGNYRWLEGGRWCFVQYAVLQVADEELDGGEWYSTSLLPPGMNQRQRQQLVANAIQRYEASI